MIVAGDFASLRTATTGEVGLVPTMGFLHEGHESLLRAARAADECVVMSLFVNPLQFGDRGDLSSYPRDLDRDLGIAESNGVDVVFAPSLEEMFPTEPLTRVVVPELTKRMEGSYRPGHFEGVATIVTKLLAGIQPDRAYFGRKDAQQLAVVTRLVADLSLPVAVVGSPTLREEDGLALSSRNVRLDTRARRRATALSKALLDAADRIEEGERSVRRTAAAVWDALVAADGVEPEYAEWAAAADMSEPDAIGPGTFLAVAAHVGGVRLIDNIHVDGEGDDLVVDRGIRIDGPSMLYEQGVP